MSDVREGQDRNFIRANNERYQLIVELKPRGNSIQQLKAFYPPLRLLVLQIAHIVWSSFGPP